MKNKTQATKAFEISYTKKIGGKGTITVKAIDESNALANAKQHVFTGKDFKIVKEVAASSYSKPRKQGFQGSDRAN